MTEDDPLEPIRNLIFDYPYFYQGSQRFFPVIYDGGLSEGVPEGFNSVRIPLDGTLRSDLKWDLAAEQARKHRERGLKIVWDLDLGLFSRLTLPFFDSFQIQALTLSLQHFCQTIWSEFADATLGIVVYRGLADFSMGFPWDAERREAFRQWLEEIGASESPHLTSLFCRDCCSLYLNRLVSALPGYLQPMMMVDASFVKQPRHLVDLLHREAWERFAVAIKSSSLPTLGIGWESESMLGEIGRKRHQAASQDYLRLGLCLPSLDDHSMETAEALDKALAWLGNRPCRFVIEGTLTGEWDGLDDLIVLPHAIGPITKRKLQGFQAAGGTVLDCNDLPVRELG